MSALILYCVDKDQPRRSIMFTPRAEILKRMNLSLWSMGFKGYVELKKNLNCKLIHTTDYCCILQVQVIS